MLKNKIIKLYESGKSAKEISEELSVPKSTVYYNLKVSGYDLKASTPEDEENFKLIFDLLNSGSSVENVSVKTGLSRSKIKKILTKKGFLITEFLTPREYEFMKLNDRGLSQAEIANTLGVTRQTVSKTLQRIELKKNKGTVK
jgi:DNA-binding NarL/FixJ family response regulator